MLVAQSQLRLQCRQPETEAVSSALQLDGGLSGTYMSAS